MRPDALLYIMCQVPCVKCHVSSAMCQVPCVKLMSPDALAALGRINPVVAQRMSGCFAIYYVLCAMLMRSLKCAAIQFGRINA